MNPEQENFDQLRRLLKIKRYEQPPPRYFKDFSSQVIARISSEPQGSRSVISAWLHRVGELLQAKPALSGAFGAVACAALFMGVVYNEQGEPASSSWLVENTSLPADGDQYARIHDSGTQLASISSTNAMIQLPGSLFSQIQQQLPVLANFRIGN